MYFINILYRNLIINLFDGYHNSLEIYRKKFTYQTNRSTLLFDTLCTAQLIQKFFRAHTKNGFIT